MSKYLVSAMAAALLCALAAPASAESGRKFNLPLPPLLPGGCGALADVLSLRVHGLTADQRLICFRAGTPAVATSVGSISGLAVDTRLVGIDYRVQDGKLYGVGDAGGVYLVDPRTAQAALVNRLSVALSGSVFGVDFNPAADRLRIVSDTGQNLRHNVNAGGTTLVDGTLAYTPGTPAASVGGSAYTNNDLDANTATTLFGYDTALDQVVIQSPANAGTLAPTGESGVDAAGAFGVDIYSTLYRGATIDNEGYAVLQPADGRPSLYEVDPLTGKATPRGAFAGQYWVVDIAIPLGQR